MTHTELTSLTNELKPICPTIQGVAISDTKVNFFDSRGVHGVDTRETMRAVQTHLKGKGYKTRFGGGTSGNVTVTRS